MKLQASPNWWSCLPTAFAIALDTPVRQLFAEIGHDGSELVFPQLEEPYSRRAFSPQELIDPCLRRGYCPLLVEAVPIYGDFEKGQLMEVSFPELYGDRLARYMLRFIGVLTGEKDNNPHAVAWDRTSCYDPNGLIYSSKDFSIREFWALVPIADQSCVKIPVDTE